MMLVRRGASLGALLLAIALAISPLASLSASAQLPALAPRIRVVHASPGTAAVDVTVSGITALTDLAYGSVSSYVVATAGTVTVAAVPTGTVGPPIASVDVTAVAGVRYTVVITGSGMAIGTLVLEDAATPPAVGTSSIRFVHVSPDTGAVDVAVTGGDTLAAALAYPAASPYVLLTPGTHSLEVRAAGTSTVALAVPDTMVQSATAYTVFIIGLAAGPPALSAVVAPDAGYAALRIMNASPDAPAVDVYVEGAKIATAFAFGDVSFYTLTVSNTYGFVVFPTGTTTTPLLMSSVALAPNLQYTAVLAGMAASPTVVLLTDTIAPPAPGMALVRFVNLSPGAPPVDVHMVGYGLLATVVFYPRASDYMSVAAGAYDLLVTNTSLLVTGTGIAGQAPLPTISLSLPMVSLREGNVYTFFIVGMVTGTPALDVLQVTDAQFEYQVMLPTVRMG